MLAEYEMFKIEGMSTESINWIKCLLYNFLTRFMLLLFLNGGIIGRLVTKAIIWKFYGSDILL